MATSKRKGKTLVDEYVPERASVIRKQLSESHKKQVPWNKGLKNTGGTWDKERKKKMSLRMKGNKYRLGSKQTPEIVRKRIKKGKEHYNWKGGKSSISRKLRTSNEWKTWREQVFMRDDFTCQSCNTRNVELHPHHIRFVTDCIKENRIEWVFDVNNGMTLCKSCHMNAHYPKGGVV